MRYQDYFTTFVFVATIVCLVFQIIARVSGAHIPSLASFIVIASLITGSVGSYYVAEMCAKGKWQGKEESKALYIHTIMHMLPLVVGIVLLCGWRQLCGKPPTAADAIGALVLLSALFTAYFFIPATSASGAQGFKKLKEVYGLDPAWMMSVGSGVAVLGTFSIALFGMNQHHALHHAASHHHKR